MALATLNKLYFVLRSKPEQEKITPEESSTIVSCHLKVLGTAGSASGTLGGLAWLVANRFKRVKGQRLILAAGAATATFGVAMDWASSRTAVSCIDDILKQNPTRMQKELVNVLAESNRGEEWRYKLMSKYSYHFDPEAIYFVKRDTPPPQKLFLVPRLASSYDYVSEVKSQTIPNGLPNSPNQSTSHASNVSRTKQKVQDNSGNSDEDMEEDPVDCIFGDSETTESNLLPGKDGLVNRKELKGDRN